MHVCNFTHLHLHWIRISLSREIPAAAASLKMPMFFKFYFSYKISMMMALKYMTSLDSFCPVATKSFFVRSWTLNYTNRDGLTIDEDETQYFLFLFWSLVSSIWSCYCEPNLRLQGWCKFGQYFYVCLKSHNLLALSI